MTGLLPPTPAVLRSYRLSTYCAGTVVARIGWPPVGLDGRSRVSLVLLSACNPGGRRRSDGSNRRMMRRLGEAMRRIAHVTGEGRLGRWSEPLLLAAMAPARGIVLARRFRQNAVVVLRCSRPARLVLLAGTGAVPSLAGRTVLPRGRAA